MYNFPVSKELNTHQVPSRRRHVILPPDHLGQHPLRAHGLGPVALISAPAVGVRAHHKGEVVDGAQGPEEVNIAALGRAAPSAWDEEIILMSKLILSF